jgi:hypothetical protein
MIDWPTFKNAISEWITNMSSSSIGITILDQSGYLSFKDKITLH